MKRLGPRLRSVWLALWRSQQVDAEMHDEMRFHVEMEAERLVREHGLDPREAARRAHVAFGGVEKYRAAGRETRGLQWLDAIALDCRLGVRMLVKHRWLSLIGSSAIAVAIAIGASAFEIVTELMYPTFPLDAGNRVVAVQLLTDNPGNPERRLLHDFFEWRESIASVTELGAFRTVEHNLIAGDASPEPVTVAEMTASGFLVARTPPLLGRYLMADDERAGAPLVAVIGYNVWQARFGGDPTIVGRTISLGGNPHVVVGVMPQGFTFPIRHQYWIPLRLDPARYGRLESPTIYVFGRLAPGISMDEAQAELTVIGQRTAAAHRDKYERLRLTVSPYPRALAEVEEPIVAWSLWMGQLLVSGLVLVVGVNLAILVYARTIARIGEISVRTALGASRRRILVQLFVEAFALTAIGAGAGLLLAQVALSRFEELVVGSGGTPPFWLNFDLSASTALYALLLAMLAAVVVGVLPGLKATNRRLQVHLRELSGATAARLGPTWTFLVVAQVAIAVAALPLAVWVVWEAVRVEIADAGFPVEQYVTGYVALNEDAPASRLRVPQRELMRRLELEPGVAAVTFSSRVPGEVSDFRRIEFDPSTPLDQLAPAADRRPVGILQVAPNMLDVYGARLLAGRTFDAGDLGGTSAIVNRTFVEQFMGERPALGQQFRYVREAAGTDPSASSGQAQRPAEWHVVIGIVDDFPAFPLEIPSGGQPTVYHPAAPGDIYPVVVTAQFKGGIPADFAPRVRAIAAEIDPAMQLAGVMPLSETYDSMRSLGRSLAWGLSLVTTSVLLLSAAGMYALMSFIVAQRAREIGIRTALGGPPRRILIGIFKRSLGQLALGVIVGSVLSAAPLAVIEIGSERATSLVVIVAAIVVVIGILAALGPAVRALRIQPTDVLRAET